jgi:hypothetical protein
MVSEVSADAILEESALLPIVELLLMVELPPVVAGAAALVEGGVAIGVFVFVFVVDWAKAVTLASMAAAATRPSVLDIVKPHKVEFSLQEPAFEGYSSRLTSRDAA